MSVAHDRIELVDMSKSEDSIMIGGVGGSGTRVFAESLLHAGVRSSSDLNKASDHLGSTLLFKRREILDDIRSGRFERSWSLLEKAFHGGGRPTGDEKSFLKSLASQPRMHHKVRWLKKRCRALFRAMRAESDGSRWFVKEPNLHVIAPAVFEIRDNVRMVMVVRHGVDMAFSGNQQQLQLWGPVILDEPDLPIDPVSSLRYWCRVHRQIMDLARTQPDHVRILSFDQLCRDPESVLGSLFDFVGVECSERLLEASSRGVRPPNSMDRRHHEDLSVFSSTDLEFVDEFMERIESTTESVKS